MQRQETNPAERVERGSGIYRLIAGVRMGQAQAIACAGPRRIAAVSADSVDEALDVLEAQIDARRAVFRQLRAEGVPTAEELHDLWNSMPGKSQTDLLQMFRVHAGLRGAAGTAQEIARRSGRDQSQVWWAYGRFGRKLISALDVALPEPSSPMSREIRPIRTFATLERDGEAADWTITLRPSIIEAVRRWDTVEPLFAASPSR